MIQQRLLFLWAEYATQHVVHVVLNGVIAALVFSGSIATVITASPVHVRQPVPPPAVVKNTPTKAATAPVAKPKPPDPVTPVEAPAPAQAVAAPPAVPQPKPFPVSAPSPGSSAKALLPASPAPASAPPQSASAPASTDPAAASPASPSPPSYSPPLASGGYTSTNWSGYVATDGGYTAVSGAWRAPAVTGNGSTTTADSSWIGIGGVFTNDLIQTGTENSVSASGQVYTAAFYELLPGAAIEIPSLSVSSSDNMSASITETSPGKWLISITDVSTGQNYTTTVDYASSHSSVEWIEEDPSYLNGTQVPFDTFTTVSFANGSAKVNGVTANIAASNGQPITMLNAAGQPIATPSILTASGAGFNVYRN